MTQEEKAKAYDEALNWMRELYPGLHGATKEDAEHYFPELRESEDERIRRTLVGYFGPQAQLDFIRGVPIQKIRDWLENQKEPENVSASTMAPSCWTKVPEQCLKCNEYEIGYKAGYTHGCTAGYNKAMKEVEENPKSADSIPADCASGAKCGDRWQKVGDSLPDNPREVLCKDEAGNYFIGRYYVGEGWEISNYDDEDKPHHLNPPVSKWIDFPSEKQKEQTRGVTINGEPINTETQQVDISAEWSEEDEKMLSDLRNTLSCLMNAGAITFKTKKKFSNWLKDLHPQPKQEWSEEDSKRYISIGTTLETSAVLSKEDYDANMAWLRELVNAKKYSSPKPSWKPSKKQMDRLFSIIAALRKDYCDDMADFLASLYEQLKKL